MLKNVANQVVSARLIALADGTAVTSGTTTVYVNKDGGTQATGSGTVTHEGNGEWSYVPTQAETNANQVAFMFTNSLSVGALINVYPQIPGGAADGPVINGTNANRISTPEFEATTVTLGSGGDVTIDSTGITLVSPAALTIGSATITEAILADLITTATRGADVLPTTGTVTTTADLPANFSTLGINSSGHISRVTLVDTVTTLTGYAAPLDAAGVRSAVGLASANLDTQLGDIASDASSAATDAGIASTNTSTLTSRLTATRAGYLDNLSAGAVALQSTLTTVAGYVDTEVAAIKAVTDKVDTTLVLDGSVYQFTVNALENAPAGGGGGGGDNITVTPLQITAQEIPTFTINGATVWNISAAQNSTQGFLFAVVDATNTAVNLSAKTLRFVLHSAKAPYAPYGELASGSGISVGGGSNNQVTVTLTQALTARPFEGAYKLWNITDNYLLGSGSITIKPAPNDF